MKKKKIIVAVSFCVALVVALALVLFGCRDKKEQNGILVENADGIEVLGNVEASEVGPDGSEPDDNNIEIVLDSDEEVDPSDDDFDDGPSSPMEEAEMLGLTEYDVTTDPEGPMADGDVKPDGVDIVDEAIPGPEGAVEVAVSDEEAGSPMDAIEVDDVAEEGAGPEGGHVADVPSFSSSGVSADGVVSAVSRFISMGSGDEAPDGSKIWSASNGTYSVDIQADSNNKVYSAFFTCENGDMSFIEACAGAFDSGAVAFVSSNEEGSYESNGVVFEIEAKSEDMYSLRVSSKSYQSILGSPQ